MVDDRVDRAPGGGRPGVVQDDGTHFYPEVAAIGVLAHYFVALEAGNARSAVLHVTEDSNVQPGSARTVITCTRRMSHLLHAVLAIDHNHWKEPVRR